MSIKIDYDIVEEYLNLNITGSIEYSRSFNLLNLSGPKRIQSIIDKINEKKQLSINLFIRVDKNDDVSSPIYVISNGILFKDMLIKFSEYEEVLLKMLYDLRDYSMQKEKEEEKDNSNSQKNIMSIVKNKDDSEYPLIFYDENKIYFYNYCFNSIHYSKEIIDKLIAVLKDNLLEEMLQKSETKLEQSVFLETKEFKSHQYGNCDYQCTYSLVLNIKNKKLMYSIRKYCDKFNNGHSPIKENIDLCDDRVKLIESLEIALMC
jgi:hypothetical protein